jgi:uroporphyrinogen decarboxylase
MSGKADVLAAIAGEPQERLPCLPILHSGLPPLFGVPAGAFFTSAEKMAEVMINGYRSFGYDGVQLSLGVTGEVEALGASVEQPGDGAPVLREYLLPDLTDHAALEVLRARAAQLPGSAGRLLGSAGRLLGSAGRLPLFFDAVTRTVDAIGEEAFVLATLRGPLLIASQLCGVEPLLISLVTQPDAVARVLDFTVDLAYQLGVWLLDSGADGLVLGEATCSPNFISPRLYRMLVQPHHERLMSKLRAAGWATVGLHICGNIVPILEDVIRTGVTWVDIDHQVPAEQALRLADDRVILRGNLDPSSTFRFGTTADVDAAVTALLTALKAAKDEGLPGRWIASNGCDIPPGTPAGNIRAFVERVRSGPRAFTQGV